VQSPMEVRRVVVVFLPIMYGPDYFSKSIVLLKGRNLADGVLVIDEIVDFAKKSNLECLILKVDFEKAYDSVN
jgi:hypothetical protein